MVLEKHYKEIVSRIENLDMAASPAWGTLTAPRLIAHLIDSLLFARGAKVLEIKKPPLVPKWLIKWLTIYSPMPWPKGIKAPPSFFEYDPQEFDADKQELIKQLDAFIALPDSHATDHPLMGRLSKKDWDHLNYRHFNHHFRQFNCPVDG